jgi:hypothetical protein
MNAPYARSFIRHLVDVSFERYNNSAPREDGDWVFSIPDSDLVEEVLEEFVRRESRRIGLVITMGRQCES